MQRIDRLLSQVRKFGSEWKPDVFYIHNTDAGEYFVICEYWDGVPGSANPDALEKSGRKRYDRLPEYAQSFDDAQILIEQYKRLFEKEHGLAARISTTTIDCALPRTDAERKASWKAQGSTVAEYWAENQGLSFAEYLSKENMDPAPWSDILRWRREDGKE